MNYLNTFLSVPLLLYPSPLPLSLAGARATYVREQSSFVSGSVCRRIFVSMCSILYLPCFFIIFSQHRLIMYFSIVCDRWTSCRLTKATWSTSQARYGGILTVCCKPHVNPCLMFLLVWKFTDLLSSPLFILFYSFGCDYVCRVRAMTRDGGKQQ